MSISIFTFDSADTIANTMSKDLNAILSLVHVHHFPDHESCIRIVPDEVNDVCIVFSSLYDPDVKSVWLLFLSETLRDYGAERIILVAPYLAYMRQDKRFNEGEGVSAEYFARLISRYFDALITIDPHLHRIKSLNDVYSVPARSLHAASTVATWIKENISQALLIGPDSESEQWVSELAEKANAPFVILEKTRHGDRDVSVSVPDVDKWMNHQPVLFDDIISTGKTMIETVKHLKETGMKAPVCIAVHAIFADDAYQALLDAGVERIVTCNTIPHTSNTIDVSPLITEGLQSLLKL